MFLLWGKHIRKYYLRYLFFFLIALGSLITVDWFQLKLPEILGSIVGHLQKNGNIDLTSNFFKETMLNVLIVAIILFAGRVLWRINLFFVSKKIEQHLRKEMFLKAEQLDITYYHSTKVGNIMSWATNDLETLEEFLGWGSLQLIDGIFLTSFTLIKMFILDYSLALIALVPIALIGLVGAICAKHMNETWRLRQESNDALYDYSQENFTGIRVIKAFVKEVQQIHEFSKIARKNQEINVKFTRISILFDVSIEVVIGLVSAVILAFGGWFVYATSIGSPIVIFNREIILEANELVTFFGYFFYLIWPMIALGQVITMFSKAAASYKRIANFLDAPINIVDKESAKDIDIEGNIEFKDFSFSYPEDNNKESLSHISLKINKGEIIGIVGTVGSGKSTLTNALLHLYNVNPLQVYIDGTPIEEITLAFLRKNVALAPQDNFLFSGTILDNISFNDDEPNLDKAVAAAKESDLEKDLAEFDDGINSTLEEGGHTISGGQKQRIALARAIYKDAPILILDDVVSAVDLKTEENILNNIRTSRVGKTTLIVASRVSTVMNADKVIVLSKGKLEAFDTPENLLKTSETFKTMTLLQKLSAGGKI